MRLKNITKNYTISKEKFKELLGIKGDRFYVTNLTSSDDIIIEVIEDEE